MIKYLDDLLEYVQPQPYIVSSTDYNGGDIPVLTANQSFILGYTDEKNGIFYASEKCPVIIFDDFTCDIKFVDFPFKVKSSALKILRSRTDPSTLKFVYEMMKLTIPLSNNHKRHWISETSHLAYAMPSTNDQVSISKLSTLIDKIMQSQRQEICLLRQILSTIYNYWFVQFDFPDKNGRPYKSSGGKMVYNEQLKQEVPEGWKVSNLANTNLATVIKPGINNFIGEKTYLATGDVNGDNISNKAKSITYTNRESRANMQPTFNSVWFAKMKDSVKHIIITDSSSDLVSQCILSTGFCGLQANSITLCYLAAYISQPQFEQTKNMLAHGATQKAISNSDLSSVTILEPDDATLQKFAGIVYPMLELIDNCRQQSKQLASLRDWLLPMLMNGQVEIRDARDNSGSNLSDIN